MREWRWAVSLLVVLLSVGFAAGDELPWKAAGLTDREAAAHLLDRLTFGARPGDVDAVVEMGLEAWVDHQLAGDLADRELERRVAPLETMGLSGEEAAERFPNPGVLLMQARQAGVISDETAQSILSGNGDRRDPDMRRQLLEYARQKGYGAQRQLLGELMVNKLLRATYSENQLQEVLTDFWFHHFNVSLTDNQSRVYIPSYEQEAIRPHVLGDFRDMLGATARHPAMLLYLDNAQSTADESSPTTMERQMRDRYGERARRGMERHHDRQRQRPNRSTGLNENYARELLELHTLGVDGGYTQEDVIDVARAFTGWSVVPPAMVREMENVRLERAMSAGVGFEREGNFLFRADAHDEGKKSILGRSFPAGRGIEEGEAVLDLVAEHPSTAEHLGRKLAVRFVSDDPSGELVDRLAEDFRRTDGDLRSMIETLIESPEFWSPEARRQKIKSPFELATSALRALDAEIREPRETVEWIQRMGQPLYAYQAPTGYPDRADFWVNTGSLLNRMNFGLELATGRVRGVEIDLAALNGNREPESTLDALETYAALLMPERDLESTIAQLEPMVTDPHLGERLSEAAPEPESAAPEMEAVEMDVFGEMRPAGEGQRRGREAAWRPGRESTEPPTALEQVVGVILGSPEFQRR
jgi:uncharacterized protein (DUF1800 family)